MRAKIFRRIVKMVSPLPRNRRKPKQKDPTKFYDVLNHLFVPAVNSGETSRIEHVVSKLSTKTITRLSKSTVMGLCRLFLRDRHLSAVEHLLTTYLSHPKKTWLKLYFLEPLTELDRAGRLQTGPLFDFVRQFEPQSHRGVLDWLDANYQPADEADRITFHTYIITPLRELSDNPSNLMDIRFFEEQRRLLQDRIRRALREERPLSLLRLGDGEAYPFEPPDARGIDRGLFRKDDVNFEGSRTHWGVSPPPGDEGEKLIKSFRQAVARCDVLGIPSVYRIIRNMTPPPSRFGTRRNQRAFIRILGAVGSAIPTSGKVFTEERCHRIRQAIDQAFLVELSAAARSLILVSCRAEVQSRFSRSSTFIPVPGSGIELFRAYTEVTQRICEATKPGTLVLIGAGVPAKIMADQACQAGAVALDVGSLMDYMVGQKTRTIADLA